MRKRTDSSEDVRDDQEPDPGTSEGSDKKSGTQPLDPEQGEESTPPGSGEETPSDPQELAAKYQAAVRGITEKGQKLGEVERQNAVLQDQVGKLQAALQNPKLLKALQAALPDAEPEDDIESVATATKLDADIVRRMDAYLKARGVLTEKHEKVGRFEQVLMSLAGDRVDGSWRDLVEQFPAAKEAKDKVYAMVEKTNGALTLEEAFHAVTKGKYGETKQKEEMQVRKDAQLLRPRTRDLTKPAAAKAGQNGKVEFTVDTLAEIMREEGIDAETLFGKNVFSPARK